ncbi:MAG: MFS transporter [Candidatus Odinarchaeota archaeon]
MLNKIRNELGIPYLRFGFAIASATVAMWIFHYWFDYLIITNQGVLSWHIAYHLCSVPMGALAYLGFLRKKNSFHVTISSGVLVYIFMGVSALIADPLIGIITFLLVGFFVGIVLAALFPLVATLVPSIEIRGFSMSSHHQLIAIVSIIGVLLSTALEMIGFFLFYLINGLVLLLLGLSVPSRDLEQVPPDIDLPIVHQIKNRELVPAYLVSLFLGFFFTSIYYSILDFLVKQTAIPDLRFIQVITFFLVIFIVASPLGKIADKIGRKVVILAGIYLQGIALVLTAVIPDLNLLTILVIITPLLAIGVEAGIFLGFLIISELTPETGRRTYSGITSIFFGCGMTLGLILSEAVQTGASQSPLTLNFVLLLMYFTYTLVVVLVKEPLPSRAEREWHSKIRELLVISKSGLPLFHHSFSVGGEEIDSALTSGALTGINQLIPEITRQDTRLKVVKQENFCVLFEHSSRITLALLAVEDLAILRKKMRSFLAEFELFFGKLIDQWMGDTIVFSPAERLVKTNFSYENT